MLLSFCLVQRAFLTELIFLIYHTESKKSFKEVN